MWTRWGSLVVVLTLLPLGASAEEGAPRRERGFLTGLGLSLLVVGAGAAAVGTSGFVTRSDAARLLGNFGSTLPEAEVTTYRALERRFTDANLTWLIGWVAGGAALTAAVICLVLDTPKPPVQLSVTPTPQGGAVSLWLTF